MQIQGHQRVAGPLHLANELGDLFCVKQQLAVRVGSGWMWVEADSSGVICMPTMKISAPRITT
jgi:hypothetical protein